ncbi:MAG TPA: tetratricopeptide repeat protein [Planctomycetota bacterium]|nr:tetratricopeptide repeat protein [Planctomycetota bacterium]
MAPPEPIDPRLFLSANDLDDAVVPSGWPLVLELTVLAPIDHPLKVAALETSIRLILPEGGWNPQSAPGSSGDVDLGLGKPARLVWTLLPAELDGLPRGNYRFSATLDASAAPGDAWKGTVSARACRVTLAAAKARLTPAEEARRTSLLARVLIGRRRIDEARGESDALLKRQPRSPEAWLLSAQVLEAAGKGDEARKAWSRAWELTPGKRPPVGDLGPHPAGEPRY